MHSSDVSVLKNIVIAAGTPEFKESADKDSQTATKMVANALLVQRDVKNIELRSQLLDRFLLNSG